MNDAISFNLRMSQLESIAHDLNMASDNLGSAIATLDERLRQLNLGVAGWITISSGKDWSRDFGYAKIGNKWGLALREIKGEEKQEWKFNDGPRFMRVESVSHIPDLLEVLVKRASEMVVHTQQACETVIDYTPVERAK